MTKRDELLALAERCEKATEGSSTLDGLIAHAAGYRVGDDDSITAPNGNRADAIPGFTTSLDAAMTLVPEGFKWKCGYSRYVDHVAEVVDYNSYKGTYVAECVSGSRSLALCAAALRAAAEMEG